eukprot:409275-Lingulodinium_polyedra.AAC.1
MDQPELPCPDPIANDAHHRGREQVVVRAHGELHGTGDFQACCGPGPGEPRAAREELQGCQSGRPRRGCPSSGAP